MNFKSQFKPQPQSQESSPSPKLRKREQKEQKLVEEDKEQKSSENSVEPKYIDIDERALDSCRNVSKWGQKMGAKRRKAEMK